jgi:tRNA threonylcarbamoyl adenosine modification protein YeaZ
MRLIAIDTSWEACSVGVIADGRTLTRSEIVGRRHAEILMGMIEDALAAVQLAVADLDRIAVTVGPGSFTGLRVGIAAARGLALVLGRTAVGIGTFAVHAEEARAANGTRAVLAALAAGRGEIYGAIYAADGSEMLSPRTASAEVLAAEVTDGMLIAGSGADLILAALPMDTTAQIAHRHSAADIAALCRLALAAPEATASPRPLYLRPPDAKPQAAARIAHR